MDWHHIPKDDAWKQAHLTHQPAVHRESIEETAAWIERVLADPRYDQSTSDKKSKEIIE